MVWLTLGSRTAKEQERLVRAVNLPEKRQSQKHHE